MLRYVYRYYIYEVQADKQRNNTMKYPITDNCCTNAGWIEYIADTGANDLHISIPPHTDTDGKFLAFCHAEQEMIRVTGWNVTLVAV